MHQALDEQGQAEGVAAAQDTDSNREGCGELLRHHRHQPDSEASGVNRRTLDQPPDRGVAVPAMITPIGEQRARHTG